MSSKNTIRKKKRKAKESENVNIFSMRSTYIESYNEIFKMSWEFHFD